MPPMTTRALRVTVLAAGLAAAGTSTASAATAPSMAGLRSAPDEINKHEVVNPCRGLKAPQPERCPEVAAHVQSPTVLKQVGVDVVRGGHELRGNLSRPGLPVDPEKVDRAVGTVGGVVHNVDEHTNALPNVDATVRPGAVNIPERPAQARSGPAEPHPAAEINHQLVPPTHQVAGELGHHVSAVAHAVDSEGGKLLNGKELPLQIDDSSSLHPGS